MGQSLRVETQSQDPQQHNNGGEFQDSLMQSVYNLDSCAFLNSNIHNMKSVYYIVVFQLMKT